eukprot:CAMPEP_0197848632 /NCGR_PEP_ID=MMETSP1438-20131217/9408_1 /TAXON_ID=1461541 /ORGANISM="Pterosperma sp., Strain CCMP1384" /LENGTH=94 /DNA_ID=CAMNT_0043460975 /DNA_START=168 /DNA_END=452 /DNA_ORIENTATION=-
MDEMDDIIREAASALRSHINLIDKLMLEMEDKENEIIQIKGVLNKNHPPNPERARRIAELRKEREALVSKVGQDSPADVKPAAGAGGSASKYSS